MQKDDVGSLSMKLEVIVISPTHERLFSLGPLWIHNHQNLGQLGCKFWQIKNKRNLPVSEKTLT